MGPRRRAAAGEEAAVGLRGLPRLPGSRGAPGEPSREPLGLQAAAAATEMDTFFQSLRACRTRRQQQRNEKEEDDDEDEQEEEEEDDDDDEDERKEEKKKKQSEPAAVTQRLSQIEKNTARWLASC